MGDHDGGLAGAEPARRASSLGRIFEVGDSLQIGDHAAIRGERATLWLRVERQRDRSTYYVTVKDGFRRRKTAQEPATEYGWRTVTAAFAAADREAWDAYIGREARSRVWDTVQGHDVDIVVTGVFLVGGFGLGPFIKTRAHNLRFGDDRVLLSLPGEAIETLWYRDVRAIAVDGETITSGGGFIGGGVGVEGAAEGMAVATVLNALTTRTSIKTVLELQVAQSHYVFLSTTEPARALTTRLLPVQAKLRLAHPLLGSTGAETGAEPGDAIGGLERLAALHTAGALTDAEFAAAKQKLIFG